jgi:hypothetical protein
VERDPHHTADKVAISFGDPFVGPGWPIRISLQERVRSPNLLAGIRQLRNNLFEFGAFDLIQPNDKSLLPGNLRVAGKIAALRKLGNRNS